MARFGTEKSLVLFSFFVAAPSKNGVADVGFHWERNLESLMLLYL